MQMKDKEVLIWQIFGVLFIIVIGSLFHFLYSWSNNSPIVGLFVPVNESVWEHLKLCFWPLIIFSLIEYFFVRDRVNNFIFAIAVGVIAFQLFIVVFFYIYTSIIGKNILFLDISSFIVGAFICQLVGYKIMTMRKLSGIFAFVGLSILIINALLFMIFTYYAPKLPIFLDKTTNTYGAKWHQ